MQTYRTTLGEVSYRYDKRSDHTVLLYNGTFTNVEMRDAEQYFISKNYSVISVARPGYGKTSAEFAYQEGLFEKAVLELLREKQLNQVIVLGISVGGRSAMRFASLYPSYTEKLILFSSASFSNWQNRIGSLASRYLFGTAFGKIFWKVLHFCIRIAPFYGTAFVYSVVSKKDTKSLLRHYTKSNFDNLRAMFLQCDYARGVKVDISHENEASDPTKITVPTYIFHSKYDAAVPLQHPQVLRGQIKGSQLFINETDSHLMWFSEGWAVVEKQLDQVLEISNE